MYMIESNIPKINVKSEYCPPALTHNATLNAKKKIGSEKSINTLKIWPMALSLVTAEKNLKTL